MKKRTGFVSNSSSSSFIALRLFRCEICGESDGGFDIGLVDVEMCECENGHVMCQGHVRHYFENEISKYLESKDGEEHDYIDSEDHIWYSLPEQFCPICQRKEVSVDEIRKYMKCEGTYERYVDEFKEKFRTNKDFVDYCRKHK